MRGVMSRIYKVGILHEHVANNAVLHVETRSKTDYKAIVITPEQTLAILKSLASPLHFTLVLTLRRHGAPRFGDAGAALVGLTVGGRTDSDFEALGKRRGWRDQNRKLQWLRAVTYRARALLAWMAGTDTFRLRWGFCFSIPQGGGPCSPLRVCFRRRSSASGGKESRSAHRGRAEVWTSQLASQPKQLVGEQGES